MTGVALLSEVLFHGPLDFPADFFYHGGLLFIGAQLVGGDKLRILLETHGIELGIGYQ